MLHASPKVLYRQGFEPPNGAGATSYGSEQLGKGKPMGLSGMDKY